MDSQEETARTPLLLNPSRLRNYITRSSNFNLKTNIWSELGGSVGDLGTYIPIVLALSLVNHLDLGTTLIFTAFYNIVTGFLFGIPMPVQPMKSIAAVAISESQTHLTIPQIMAAGISTASVLLILGATGLMSVFYKFIPLPVVRGVQLSQGLAFAFTAIKYIRYDQNFTTGKSGLARPWLGLDGLVLSLSAVLFIILVTGAGGDDDVNRNSTIPQSEEPADSSSSNGSRRRGDRRLRILKAIPAALKYYSYPSIVRSLKFGPSKIGIVKITWEDWKIGFVRAAIPQIPLSVLNSVIAVCKLSTDLFPDREVTAASVSVSVGLMNLVGCWFGAMPCCHGAGGLAGQYRFGGRSGASVLFLGIGKLVLGLVFGNSFVRILSEFPIGILGVMLLFSGIELAMASRDMKSKEESFVMLVCAAVSLTGSSAALGFGVGIVVFVLVKVRNMDFSSGWFPKCESSSSVDANNN
ncbi:hypothetical protein MKW92_039977 [Papaver armeniacum]|nr:hypothetical protein MKW92_039977 [Papaver armeniacum]